MSWKDKIAALEAEVAAAEAAVSTAEFTAHASELGRYEELLERGRVAYETSRDAKAKEMLFEHDSGKAVAVKLGMAEPHIFVVGPAGAARYKALTEVTTQNTLASVGVGKKSKIDRDGAVFDYVLAGLLGWSKGAKDKSGAWVWTDINVDDEESENGAALAKFLKGDGNDGHPAVMAQLHASITGLDAAGAEEAKS